MKGISLSMETVVLLILMVIVLGALLAFFTGVFNPSQNKIEMLRNKESTCLKYVFIDPGCNHAKEIAEATAEPYKSGKYPEAKSAMETIAGTICNKPAGDPVCGAGITDPKTSRVQCLLSCCSIQCGK
ncbi:MAG: hypothetical protein HZB65_04730 [Candidatus Aenigmarchaeota archaeon]|nr:hypothetical protein [Candidatus Aenigmarchaeota archaeon]